MPKLAVMFIHGVEINDPRFADTATTLLTRAFTRYAGVRAEDALVIKPAFWAPVLDSTHDQLLDRIGAGGAKNYFHRLTSWATSTDVGSAAALSKLVASGLIRRLTWVRDFHFPTLRWLIVHYVGDAVAYQINSTDQVLYDGVHAVVASTLRELAKEAGDDAVLCVIAHSLGTVIASNFFYDLQVEAGCFDVSKKLLKQRTRENLGSGPLEQGETLTFLYTLGSPIALWTGRFPDCGVPIHVPDPRAAGYHQEIGGEWVNIYDRDDLVATPLKRLNALWAKQVTEDRPMSVGPWWLGWTPLSHPWYWNDRRVLDPIAQSLARAWRALGR